MLSTCRRKSVKPDGDQFHIRLCSNQTSLRRARGITRLASCHSLLMFMIVVTCKLHREISELDAIFLIADSHVLKQSKHDLRHVVNPKLTFRCDYIYAKCNCQTP